MLTIFQQLFEAGMAKKDQLEIEACGKFRKIQASSKERQNIWLSQ